MFFTSVQSFSQICHRGLAAVWKKYGCDLVFMWEQGSPWNPACHCWARQYCNLGACLNVSLKLYHTVRRLYAACGILGLHSLHQLALVSEIAGAAIGCNGVLGYGSWVTKYRGCSLPGRVGGGQWNLQLELTGLRPHPDETGLITYSVSWAARCFYPF